MIVGIIAIVFGALGALGGAFGCIGSLFLGTFSRFLSGMPSAGGAGAPDPEELGRSLEAMQIPALVISTVGLFVALVLLWGGILLLRHRERARNVLLAWAAMKTLFSVIKLGFDLASTQSFLNSDTMGSTGGSGASQIMITVAFVSNILTMLWALALPVFVFIWFRRRTIRDEMREWTAALGRSDGAPHDL